MLMAMPLMTVFKSNHKGTAGSCLSCKHAGFADRALHWYTTCWTGQWYEEFSCKFDLWFKAHLLTVHSTWERTLDRHRLVTGLC